MRVRAMFVDYDGTIAPLGVPRDQSMVIKGVARELWKISLEVPVCVVTAKDFDFVRPRTEFAVGWACAAGLDIRMADGRVAEARRLRDLRRAMCAARACERLGTYTELKRGPTGDLLAVAIDWSRHPELKASVLARIGTLVKSGEHVAYDGRSAFADVYAAPPDKGKAVRKLKRLLAVKSGVMFIGDSRVDNPAFQEAEIALGVARGQPISELRCDYVVRQSMLSMLLRSLHDRRMDFTPTLPGVEEGER